MTLYFSAANSGFFDSAIHTAVPTDAVEISQAEHAALLSAEADGMAIIADMTGRPLCTDRPAPPLAETQARALTRIDHSAEQVRGRYLTPGSGQALVYQRKAAEAEALLQTISDGLEIEPDRYPHLAAEVGITAASLAEVGGVVQVQAEAWAQLSARIESVRLAAKAAVSAAPDASAVAAVLDSLIWPGDTDEP